MYILETNSFKYYLGERLLFKLPALKLHTKSRIGLIGLNGSGKTTLLELLAGIRPIPAAAKIICKTTMTILPQLKERLSKSGGERLKPTSCRRSNNNPVCCWQTNQLIILIWTICYGLKRNFGITQEP